MSLRHEIQTALAEHGLAPLHRYGQNFMVDVQALALMVELSGAGPGVRVAEVGPGTGVLTARLLDAGATVLAVEIDQGLQRLLTASLVPRGLALVAGDCLAGKNALCPELTAFAEAGPWRLASNLPYDVALPVILNAIALPRPPERIAVTIQREAAERLVSRPGSDAWGATACIAQAAGRCRLERRLGPGSFYPPPRVDSAVWSWTPSGPPLPAGFAGFVRGLFAYRRKVLTGAMRDAGHDRARSAAAIHAAGLDPLARLEQLDAPDMLRLHAALTTAPGDMP